MPMHVIEVDFHIGQTVFFRLDDVPRPGLVTGISVRPGGTSYYVTWPNHAEHQHYALELSATPAYSRPTED